MLFLFQTANLFNVRDLQLIAPELILTVIACVVLVMEVILPYKLSKWTAWFSLAGIGLALISLGAQFVSMGRSLYRTQPSFRATVDRCAELLRPHMDRSLLEVLYPAELDPFR